MSTDSTPTRITPTNPAHSFFGKVFKVIEQDAATILGELKDGIHNVEARFPKSEVKPVISQVAPTNPRHALFGKVLSVIEAKGALILTAFRDELHDVEAWFHRDDVDFVENYSPLPDGPAPGNVINLPASDSVTVLTPVTQPTVNSATPDPSVAAVA